MLYLCTTCRYQTVNKKCYFLHLQLHDEENSKPEEEEEEKEDKKKTAIKQAIPKHTCSLCDYRTNKKQLLKAHKKTHSKPMTGNVLNATIKHIENIIFNAT